jgi:predicted nucleic acid-binding protein
MTLRVFIVDASVLVAGLISSQPASPVIRVVDAMLQGRLLYLLSPGLLSEYRAVLLRPKLIRRHGLDEEQIDRLLTELTANAVWRDPLSDKGLPAHDPGDDYLWALLATEPGACLVKGDRLLVENPRPGSRVIRASEWVAGLEYPLTRVWHETRVINPVCHRRCGSAGLPAR